jgi:hypothetical protein
MFTPVEDLEIAHLRLIQIDSVQSSGLQNMIDIEVQHDGTFCLADGIISHNSARNSIQSARGKSRTIGSFSLRGKPMNVYDADTKDVIANREFANILAITGLQLGETPALPDGEWVMISVNGKELLVNENDSVFNEAGELIKVSSIL